MYSPIGHPSAIHICKKNSTMIQNICFNVTSQRSKYAHLHMSLALPVKYVFIALLTTEQTVI